MRKLIGYDSEDDLIVYNALMLAPYEGLADMVDKDLLLADTSIWLYMKEGKM